MTGITVVIPAHNEASVLARALDAIMDGSVEHVVVVANGCTDRTAEIARAHSPAVHVLELAEGSKINALNAGSAVVRAFPVAFVDADVIVSGSALTDLAERMVESGALVGSPRMTVRPSRSWWVRQYYRVWALTDYRSIGHVGSGVYVLSNAGRERFGEFPDVIADDLFVQRLFEPGERFTPDDLSFAVDAPGTLRSLIARNSRIAAGNRELAARFPALAAPRGSVGARSLATRVVRRPALWIGFIVYCAVYLTANRRAAALLKGRGAIAWTRDETTREQMA